MAKNSENAIDVRNLQKSYGDVKVLLGITFKVKRGSILALLGPNGAGKTTTIKILSTLLYGDGGKASVNGFDVREQADKVRASIGLVMRRAEEDLHNARLRTLLCRSSKTHPASSLLRQHPVQ